MPLAVLDGNGAAKTLKSTADGADQVVHHNVDAVTGVVQASQSGTWNVGVTGVTGGTGAANLGKAEDAVHAGGDTGVAVLGVRRDTPSAGVDADGDYAALGVSAAGRLWTSATIDAALPAGTNAIGKLAANSGIDIGDVDVLSLPALAAGTNVIGQVSQAGNATSAVNPVSSSATSVMLLAANAARKGAAIHNDANKPCYLKLGTTASTSSFTVKMAAGDYYEVPACYTGRIDAIWDASPTGNALVTEIT